MNNSGSDDNNDGGSDASVDASTMDSSLTHWGMKKRKISLLMPHDELVIYFEGRLRQMIICGNTGCECLAILRSPQLSIAIANYLAWFERRSRYKQDLILLQWVIYRKTIPGAKNYFFYHVPFDGSSFADDSEGGESIKEICAHRLCTAGIQTVMGIGYRRMKRICEASTCTTIMPLSGNLGTPSHATMKANDPRAAPLQHHMEYLLELGEVRATRVVATLVDGIQGRANREDTVDNVYLPMSMGYRNCYNRYMNSLGFKTRCKANGELVVDGIEMEEGGRKKKPIELGYVSFTMYYRNWKNKFSQLKVSRPAEDICQYCFVFSNRHRYFADHSAREVSTCGVNNDDDDTNIDEPSEVMIAGGGQQGIDINLPESAVSQEEESRELMVFQSAMHIRRARAQQALYQKLVAEIIFERNQLAVS
jgi:hypothetical protein